MITEFTYKILLIYPELRIPSVVQFIKDNFDPNGDKWLPLSLSADGKAPFTHGVTCFHARKADAEKWVDRYSNELGTQKPDQITTWTKANQKNWISNAKTGLWNNLGVYFEAVFNEDGEEPDFEAALLACGLKRAIPLDKSK